MTRGGMLVVINPMANHGETSGLVPVVERLLQHVPHETVLTQHVGHAAELAARAHGVDVIVAVGGDGTVHEVLNGIMRHPEGRRPALAVLPTGSGNDTRRTLGISTDLADAVMALTTGVRKRFDVGLCNGSIYFNNSFAAGLDARVTIKAVEYKETKGRSGMWLYLSALLHVLRHELYSHPVRLGFDGAAPEQRDLLIVAVTNGPTYGGGFRITPDAVPDDGRFDVCIIDPLTFAQALMRLPFVIFGKHTKMKPVHMSRHTSLSIESERPLPAQIDGEVLMERSYEITMLAGAIECLVPASRS